MPHHPPEPLLESVPAETMETMWDRVHLLLEAATFGVICYTTIYEKWGLMSWKLKKKNLSTSWQRFQFLEVHQLPPLSSEGSNIPWLSFLFRHNAGIVCSVRIGNHLPSLSSSPWCLYVLGLPADTLSAWFSLKLDPFPLLPFLINLVMLKSNIENEITYRPPEKRMLKWTIERRLFQRFLYWRKTIMNWN